MLLFCLLSFTGFSAVEDSTKRVKVQVLPSLFHTPETSWGGGITALGFMDGKDSLTRNSNFQLFLDATLMNQASFQSDFNFFTRGNKNFIQGSTDLSKFPELYFGIGNENNPEDYCNIDLRYVNGTITYYTSVINGWYIGPTVHFQKLAVKNKVLDHDGFEVDDMGYNTTGTSISLLNDHRNDMLNPTNGHYIATSFGKYFDHTGMSDGFLTHSLDARYYKSFGKLVFNSNLYAVHNSGIVPFRLMPTIGGPRFLRGYYAGRFRDNNMTLTQIEFRRPIFWRIGLAAFTGVGQVYSKTSEFALNRFHYNYGAGLRFKLNKHSAANIRIDYGRTADSDGFYIVFGECF